MEIKELKDQSIPSIEGVYTILLISMIILLLAKWKGFFKLPQSDTFVYSPSNKPSESITYRSILSRFSIWVVLSVFILTLLFQMLILPVLAGLVLEVISFINKIPVDALGKMLLNSGIWHLISLCILLFILNLFTYKKIGIEGWYFVWGKPGTRFKALLMGFLTWIIAYPLVLLFSQVITLVLIYFIPDYDVTIDQVAIDHLKKALPNVGTFLTLGFTVIFLVPIVEELLFRGYLQSYLRRFLNPFFSIGITSLLFAFAHFSMQQGLSNIQLIPSLFILSCFLGFIVERQRSIWASIGLHALFNAVTVTILFLDPFA